MLPRGLPTFLMMETSSLAPGVATVGAPFLLLPLPPAGEAKTGEAEADGKATSEGFHHLSLTEADTAHIPTPRCSVRMALQTPGNCARAPKPAVDGANCSTKGN